MLKKLFLNDRFILILIFINAIILFVGGFFKPQSLEHSIIILADNLITLLFIIELIIKLKVYGKKGYFASGWNIFDFILVVLSIPSLLIFIIDIDLLSYSFLLIFRVLRVIKTFRSFKFIPNFGKLLNGIQRALKTSIFILIAFSIYIFIIGIFSYYIFHNSGASYFEDPLISLYSTFKIFTVEGWFEIPEQVVLSYSKTQTFFTYLYFVFVVLSGGIFGLSIVNSILVDSMVSDNNEELEKKIDDLNSKVSELLIKLNNDETRKDT